MPLDPFAAVASVTGVGSAAAHARDAIDSLLRHRALRRDAGRVAAESAVRGAKASAALAGVATDDMAEPTLQGALRATANVPALAVLWSRAPGQALARLHLLVGKDLAGTASLGRPRRDADHDRFDQLLRLASASTSAPAVVVAALVHGELATLRPFGLANGLSARVAERIVLVARGVDTMAVSVPEVGHFERARTYEPMLEAYAAGTSSGVAAWVRHCCEAYARGAEEGLNICGTLS